MSQYCRVNLSISADMVEAYVQEILSSTSVSLSQGNVENEGEEDESQTLIELLYDYSERHGLEDIDWLVDPTGIDPEKLRRVPGIDDYTPARVASDYGYGDGFMGCVLAIPVEVGREIWGSGVSYPIYVVLAEDRRSPIEITDPNKIPKDAQGNPIPQYEKRIVIGGYNSGDRASYNRVVQTLGGTASKAMQSFWRKAIVERLKAARANPKYLEQMLMEASRRQNVANTDKVDVTKVQNTRVTFQQTDDQNCDFVAIITAEYAWQPKGQGVSQQDFDVRATPQGTGETQTGPRDQVTM